MSTKGKRNRVKREKKTAVLRGRCEPKLKQNFSEFVQSTPFPEAHWVRVAVVEFMDRHKQYPESGKAVVA